MMKNDSPIGFLISKTAKIVSRNFEKCLIESGGSLSGWLILLALQEKGWSLQSELSESVGIQGPTLTHHLNGMEKLGLIARKRLVEDRRSHRVEMTAEGQLHFLQMKESALSFDAKLRAALKVAEMEKLRFLLIKISAAAE
jgi:MarR family transcriptional regulator, transcriptional regulator for hemolysin